MGEGSTGMKAASGNTPVPQRPVFDQIAFISGANPFRTIVRLKSVNQG